MFATVRAAIKEDGEFRLGRRSSFLGRFAVTRFDPSIGVYKFGQDDEPYWSLRLPFLWIRLWAASTMPKGDMHLDKWGIALYERSLMLCWGHRTKFVYLPWMYDHCRVEVMLNNGSFVPYEMFRRGLGPMESTIVQEPEPADVFRETHPYTYVLEGVYHEHSHGRELDMIQRRKATITVERRSWCWRGWPFRLFRWPSMVRTTIDVSFDDEVGERSGSWKGGTVGCGYELRPDETPLECLRRMERERKF